MRYMPGRFMKHNKATEGPANLIFFDTETLPIRHADNPRRKTLVLKVGVAHYVRLEKGEPTREDELVFTDSAVFWEWVKSKLSVERPTWCFAHNIAFDLTVCHFWKAVENGEWIFHERQQETQGPEGGHEKRGWRGTFVPEDPPTIIKVRRADTRQVAWFVDSLNYYRCPLSELGAAHGLAKNYTLLPWAGMDECVSYCRNDVEILKRSILSLMRFTREHDLGVWKATIAGQAFAAFRHRFMGHSILPHNDPAARAHERRSYYGGEVGVFYTGRVVSDLHREPLGPVGAMHTLPALIQGPVYHLDVNSLYPSVMRDGHFPTQLVDIRKESCCRDVMALPTGVGASARVLLHAKSRPYPIKHRGKLWFGMGRMQTYLCGPELLSACQSGDVSELWDLHIYTTAPIFRAYVDSIYRLRLDYRANGSMVYSDICKSMLNALPGKFGQKGIGLEPLPNYDCKIQWGTVYERKVTRERLGSFGDSRTLGSGAEIVECAALGREVRIVGGNAFAVSRDGEPDSSFPAIAAWVTSYGRERMRQLRSLCGPRTVLYQDTDSLHVTKVGLRRLIRAGELHPRELGKLKLVGVAMEAEYRGIKSYTFDGQRIDAGLKASAQALADGGYREERFQRLRETIAAAPPPGVVVSSVLKTQATHDVRGLVGADGWVSPVNKVWVNGEVEES